MKNIRSTTPKDAYENVWYVEKVHNGFHKGEKVSDCMTLREADGKRDELTAALPLGSGYYYRVAHVEPQARQSSSGKTRGPKRR